MQVRAHKPSLSASVHAFLTTTNIYADPLLWLLLCFGLERWFSDALRTEKYLSDSESMRTVHRLDYYYCYYGPSGGLPCRWLEWTPCWNHRMAACCGRCWWALRKRESPPMGQKAASQAVWRFGWRSAGKPWLLLSMWALLWQLATNVADQVHPFILSTKPKWFRHGGGGPAFEDFRAWCYHPGGWCLGTASGSRWGNVYNIIIHYMSKGIYRYLNAFSVKFFFFFAQNTFTCSVLYKRTIKVQCCFSHKTFFFSTLLQFSPSQRHRCGKLTLQ